MVGPSVGDRPGPLKLRGPAHGVLLRQSVPSSLPSKPCSQGEGRLLAFTTVRVYSFSSGDASWGWWRKDERFGEAQALSGRGPEGWSLNMSWCILWLREIREFKIKHRLNVCIGIDDFCLLILQMLLNRSMVNLLEEMKMMDLGPWSGIQCLRKVRASAYWVNATKSRILLMSLFRYISLLCSYGWVLYNYLPFVDQICCIMSWMLKIHKVQGATIWRETSERALQAQAYGLSFEHGKLLGYD